jgi:hypothetical protein
MSRPSEPASASTQPSNDSQIATQVKSQIQGDSALNSLPIQAQVSNGVVTLSGQVNDEAARELAANDAAQVSGVRTVVNNLTVQTAAAAAAGVASAATAATATADAASAEAAKKADARKRQEAQEQARQQRREQARRARERQQAQADQVASNNPPAPVETQPQPQEPAPPLPPVQPPPPPPPPPQPVTRTITVPAGTDLSVRISEGLETGKTKTGDTFHGALADNLVINGQTAIRRGASVTGVVTDAKDAGHFRGKAELSLELQQVQTQDKTLPVVTEAWVQKGSARGKDTALKAGGGALFGTLLGALAGGGSGALIGAASGGAAGTAANAVTRGKQVQVPSESILHFKLKQPLKVTVTTMPGTQPVKSYNSGDTPQLQPPQ